MIPAQTQDGGVEYETLSYFLGRCYYAHLDLVRVLLSETGLDEDLRPGMGHVLFALYERDDRTISDICSSLSLSKSTMTGVVARMISAGLITASPDPHDRRAKRLRLTDEGRALEPKCRQVVQSLEGVLCKGLTDHEQLELRRLLSHALQNMRDTPGVER